MHIWSLNDLQVSNGGRSNQRSWLRFTGGFHLEIADGVGRTHPLVTERCHVQLAEVRALPLFRGLTWDDLHEQTAPFVPRPDDATDTGYFEGENRRLSELRGRGVGFSFTTTCGKPGNDGDDGNV